MLFYRISALFRAFVYKCRFKKIKMPSLIGRPLLINGAKRVYIGKRVRILPNARIEVVKGGKLIIEDNVSIGHGVHISVANEMVISKNITISSNVFITDFEHGYNQINMHVLEQPLNILKTEIGENSFIGTGTCILAGTKIGRQCIIGANSVVKGNFSDYEIIAGNPARVIKKYDFEKEQFVKVSEKNER